MKKKCSTILSICLICALAISCRPTPSLSARLDDYLGRLERITEVPLKRLPVEPLMTYPERRELFKPRADIRLSFLDIVELRQCDFLYRVAEGQSGLGKVMPDEHRLIYEAALLPAMRECVQSLPENTAENLVSLIDQKQRDWPNLYWNAVYANAALQKHFSQFDSPLLDDEMSPELIDALALVTNPERLVTLDSSEQIDSALQRLNEQHFGGRLLSALSLANRRLQEANYILSVALSTRALCPQQTKTPRAEIAFNVLSHYMQELQPVFASYKRNIAHYREALATAEEGPSAYAQWYQKTFSESGVASEFLQNQLQHAKLWQRWLADCGLVPS